MTDEDAVKEACSNFQSFCIQQIIAAWFADAPDPATLINEMLSKWETLLRARYAREARARTEQTGVISSYEDWLNDVMACAQTRIRRQLALQMTGATAVQQPVCVRDKDDHDCELDSMSCDFELQRSGKVN